MENSSRIYAKASAGKPPPPQSIAADDDHIQQALDEALRESFPASDPIAVNIAEPIVLPAPDTAGRESSPT